MAPYIVIFLLGTLAAYALSSLAAGKKRAALEGRLSGLEHTADTGRREARHARSVFAAVDTSIRGFSISAKIKRELARANWSLKVSEFMIIVILSATLAPLIVLLLTDNKMLTLYLVGGGAVIPIILLKRKQAARRKMFSSQLPDAITLISNSLKTGYSFLQSIDMVARELSPPISEEFRKVLQEIKLGIPFETAVERLVEKAGNEDLDLVMTSVNIQREVGGNLSEILDKISHTIRERIRIRGQLQTLTAQGRLSGMILCLLPPALGLFLFLVNQDYIMLLFRHPTGRVLTAFAVVTQLTGMMLIRKIIDIRI